MTPVENVKAGKVLAEDSVPRGRFVALGSIYGNVPLSFKEVTLTQPRNRVPPLILTLNPRRISSATLLDGTFPLPKRSVEQGKLAIERTLGSRPILQAQTPHIPPRFLCSLLVLHHGTKRHWNRVPLFIRRCTSQIAYTDLCYSLFDILTRQQAALFDFPPCTSRVPLQRIRPPQGTTGTIASQLLTIQGAEV